ncbi:1-phosphatidylinositol phosphodiesterase-like protein [Zalerion maritima]|uniref:1-phosphatidylinositol phosphodiesterase-like protein n=1 Tax=Zalerion maritima TaxID=339359 RepID=A0AAD5WRD1_9PEZI|nr:1-phosphatidylinositol phosphodiesterase-like protein [Zalerion maritima]
MLANLTIRNLTPNPWELYSLERAWLSSSQPYDCTEKMQDFSGQVVEPFGLSDVMDAGPPEKEAVWLSFGPPRDTRTGREWGEAGKRLRFRCPPAGKGSVTLERCGDGWSKGKNTNRESVGDGENGVAGLEEEKWTEVAGVYVPQSSSIAMATASGNAAIADSPSANKGGFVALIPTSSLSSWMSHLPDHLPLSALSIPGTHNSHTYFRALPSVRCQAVDIAAQLRNGIRFLDIRVSVSTSPSSTFLGLVHGAFPASLAPRAKTLSGLLEQVYEYLASEEGKGECVMISLKREGVSRGSDYDLARVLGEHYCGNVGSHHGSSGGKGRGGGKWWTNPRLPSLGEARGKCVLVRRFKLKQTPGAHHLGGRKEVGDGTVTDGEDSFGIPVGGGTDGATGSSASLGLGAITKMNARVNGLHMNATGFGINAAAWPDNCHDGICGTADSHGHHLRIQDWYGVGKADNIPKKTRLAMEHLERAASIASPVPATTTSFAATSTTTATVTANGAMTEINMSTTVRGIGGANMGGASASPSDMMHSPSSTSASNPFVPSQTNFLANGNTAPNTSGTNNDSSTDGTMASATTTATSMITVAAHPPSSHSRPRHHHHPKHPHHHAHPNKPNHLPPPTPPPARPLFLNFLTGSNFFTSSCWPERIAAQVNPAMVAYLCTRHAIPGRGSGLGLAVGDGGTGVVVTDWVGKNGDWDLVRLVVGMNARLLASAAGPG